MVCSESFRDKNNSDPLCPRKALKLHYFGYSSIRKQPFCHSITSITNTYKQQPNQKPRLLPHNPPASTTAQNVTALFQETETSSKLLAENNERFKADKVMLQQTHEDTQQTRQMQSQFQLQRHKGRAAWHGSSLPDFTQSLRSQQGNLDGRNALWFWRVWFHVYAEG